MGDPYYDSYKFTPFLKDASGGTSIIYRYDENYTPLASVGSSYHTIEDISYIRFHNQIMGISGDTITHAIGKNIDVSLNIYTSTGEYTEDTSTVDISGIPFIGYHSTKTINGVSDVKVFDLFQYEPSTFTFTPKDSTHPIYTEAVKTSDTEYDDFNLFVKFTSQDDSTWEASEFGSVIGLYFNPVPNSYSYNRIESYKYPTINVNNVVTSRGESEASEWKPIKDKIPNELVLPTLP
jgi:hypothetical protein